jgi:hypothetical protein
MRSKVMDSEPYLRTTQEIVAQVSSHNALFLLSK